MFRKILIAVAIFTGLLLVSAILIPVVFKGKITALIKEEINKNLNATVDFSSVSLSFFKQFPSLSLTVGNLTVVGREEFEKDTLANISELTVGVNLFSVVSGNQINIRSVILEKPRLNLIVLENGKANYQIVKEDTSAAAPQEPSAFKVQLKKYAVTDGRLSYDDRSLGFKLLLDNLRHSGSGDFTSDFFTLSTNTSAITHLWYSGIKYLSAVNTGIKADIDMDMKNMSFTFKQNEIKLNELVLGIDGRISMPEEPINIDLKYEARKSEFAHFISLIPGMYTDNFKDLKSSGTLEARGYVKGTYSDNSMPGYGVELKINNGMFQYPSLPETVRNVFVDLSVINQTGNPDNTVIDLRKFHADIGPHPVDASLAVKHPVSDAEFKAVMKGKIDFAALTRIVPLEKGTELAGILNADFSMAGRMTAVEQKKFDRIQATGNLSVINFRYKSPSLKEPLLINDCRLSLSPEKIGLLALDLKIAGTDLKASGFFENPAGYFFRNDLLKGSFTVTSTQTDLRPYMTQTTAPETSSVPATQTTALDIPSNIDFTMNFNAGRVLYDNLVLTSLKGNVSIRQKTAGLNDVSFSLLDGTVLMNGLYSSKDITKPSISFDLEIQKMDIRRTFEHFNTVKKLAPMAGKMSGRFSASFGIKGNLSQNMEPDYPSLNGEGRLQTHSAAVENFEPLVKVADALKLDQFRKATLSDANLSFKIKDGRVYVQPYEQTIAGFKVKIEGSNGIDQSIDYTWQVQLPVKNLPAAATGTLQSLIAKANSAGANLSMGETVNVNVKIVGTVTQPVISTDIKQALQGAAVDLKAKAQEELERRKQELESKAKAEAEQLKKEAEEKAKAEAERLKNQAEEKAKAEAERLKKEAEAKAKKEAEKQLKNLFNKPK